MPEAFLFLVFNKILHKFWKRHAVKTQVSLSISWVELFLKFEQCFCWKTDHFAADFSANTIEQLSEMLFYIILSTLEKFEHWNRRVLTKINRVRYHQDNYLLINVACRQDGRVRQFWPISDCIEDDLKFGVVILWPKDADEPTRHSHSLKVVGVIVFGWNKIVIKVIPQCHFVAHSKVRSLYIIRRNSKMGQNQGIISLVVHEK